MPIQPKFTDAGKALQLRALTGEEILFTKIQIGSGELGETSFKTFNALLDPKITVPITDISVSKGYAKIRGYFDNKNLDEGIYYREVGLFAKNPDDPTKEILYSYVNYGAEASYIADHTSKLIEHSVTFVAVVDDAENVSAVINGSAVYVDFTDMQKAIEDHNSDTNAHPGMTSQSLTVYVDCNSTEDDELCDGSYEHPYKNISDVEYNIPNHIKTLSIILKNTGDYILESDVYFGYSNLEKIDLAYNGSATHRPIIHGSITFGTLKNVNIRNIDFIDDGQCWNSVPVKLWFDSCETVWISSVSAQCKTTDACSFIESYSSTIYILNASVLNMLNAINAWVSSTIHILSGSFETTGSSVYYENSVIYVYSNTELTYEGTDGLVFTPETMEKISNGEILLHLTSTANPHRVSLTQAQQEGGVIDVAHGGTGLKTMTKGSLLKGNGTGVVDGVRGTGALCAETEGDPVFKTLPVGMGGTGRTTINANAVLLGDGSSAIKLAANKAGAFCSDGTSVPGFKTLPVAYGGTGKTGFNHGEILVAGANGESINGSTGTGVMYKNGSNSQPLWGLVPVGFGGTGTTGLTSEIKTTAVDGARHGHFVIAFNNSLKILVCFGRISTDALSGVDVNFSTRCGNYFKDSSYVLVFGGNDITSSAITKSNTGFSVASSAAARAADWIAFGEVHS